MYRAEYKISFVSPVDRSYRRPQLRWAAPHAVIRTYRTVFSYLIQTLAVIVLFATSNTALSGIRAIANANGWTPEGSALILTVFIFYIFLLRICHSESLSTFLEVSAQLAQLSPSPVHATHPEVFKITQVCYPRPQYRRSHIAHMRYSDYLLLVEAYVVKPKPFMWWSFPTFLSGIISMLFWPFSFIQNQFLSFLCRLRHSFDRHASPPPPPTSNLSWDDVQLQYMRHVLVGGGSTDVASDLGHPTAPVIDISDSESEGEGVFDPNGWIGRGLVWSDEMPPPVKRACRRARRVPAEMKITFVPPSSTSVSGILNQHAFDYAPSCIAQAPQVPVYTTIPPQPINLHNISVSDHLRRLLSAVPHRRALDDTFNNSWLSGSLSIRIGGFLYPLWVVRLLDDLDIFTEKRRHWLRAVRWLDSVADRDQGSFEMVEACRASFDIIPFNSVVPMLNDRLSLPTGDLATLLGDNWLNNDLIDGGAEYIRRRLPPGARTEIMDITDITIVRRLFDKPVGDIPPSRGSLEELEERIRDGSITDLYIPIHVALSHWTLLRVNVPSREFEYGDSKAPYTAKLPVDVRRALVRWLNVVLSPSVAPFIDNAPAFHVPKQEDNDSCGVVVVSMLTSHLLHSQPWSQALSKVARMEFFLRLIEVFGDDDDDADEHVRPIS